jgi:hypothetical protein
MPPERPGRSCDPYAGFERTRERIAEGRERREHLGGDGERADSNWHQTFHDLIGLSWPCEAQTEFEALWPGSCG